MATQQLNIPPNVGGIAAARFREYESFDSHRHTIAALTQLEALWTGVNVGNADVIQSDWIDLTQYGWPTSLSAVKVGAASAGETLEIEGSLDGIVVVGDVFGGDKAQASRALNNVSAANMIVNGWAGMRYIRLKYTAGAVGGGAGHSFMLALLNNM